MNNDPYVASPSDEQPRRAARSISVPARLREMLYRAVAIAALLVLYYFFLAANASY